MGAYSELDMERSYSEMQAEPLQSEKDEMEANMAGKQQARGVGEAAERAQAEAALQDQEKPAQPDSPADDANERQKSEEQARKAHEEAEVKRKAEWEAKRAEKKAAEEAQLQKIAGMSEEELLKASAERINVETERLTRRNMKEYVAEYIQTLCLDDLEFARLTMHPRKSFLHCIWYINRKAREYLEKEMEANGMQRPYGLDGIYGGDVPDEVVYGWAEEYYRAPDAQEDKDDDEEFVPKPYSGPTSSRFGKKSSGKKKAEKQKEKPPAAPKKESKTVDDSQISFGAFLQDAGKAS